jgi:hypothetical protein
MIANTQTTETSVTASFSHNGSTRTVSYDRAKYEASAAQPDYAAMIEEEHASWLAWLGASAQ